MGSPRGGVDWKTDRGSTEMRIVMQEFAVAVVAAVVAVGIHRLFWGF